MRFLIIICLFLLLSSCTRFTLKYKRDLNHKTVEAVYNGAAINQPVIDEIKSNILYTELVTDSKWLLPTDRQRAENYLANLIKLQNLIEYQNSLAPHQDKKSSQTAGEFTRFVSGLYDDQGNKISELSEKQLKLRLMELKAEFEYLQRKLK